MLTKVFAAPAVVAAISLTAMPAEAAVAPLASPPLFVTPVAIADAGDLLVPSEYGPRRHRGYRHHRHRGSSAGDLLAGVLVIGTIAAVASAANRAGERRSYPVSPPYPRRGPDYRAGGPQGLDNAADLCVSEVEREVRVSEVTRVERNADGWQVAGLLADGAGFACSIGPDGRIENVDAGAGGRSLAADDRQYDDEFYRLARARVDAADVSPQPAYPGGPLPGEGFADDTPEF